MSARSRVRKFRRIWICLGLDLGRVVTNGSMADMLRELRRGRRDFRRVPAVSGMFRGVRRLMKSWFGEQLHIVSACPPELEGKLLEWLVGNVFFSRAGLDWSMQAVYSHVHFCPEYPDKASLIRRKKLRITHFVDDRPEALIPMKGLVRHLFLFNPEPEVYRQFQDQLDGITVVWNWPELVTAIGKTMREQERRARHGRRKNNALRRRQARR